MATERSDHTLEATALVHETYLRLACSGGGKQNWNGRGDFFAAAAEAMRRLVIDNARRRDADKHGAGGNASNFSTPSGGRFRFR